MACSRVNFTFFLELLGTAVGRYGWINRCSRPTKSKRVRRDLIVVYTDPEAKVQSIGLRPLVKYQHNSSSSDQHRGLVVGVSDY